MNQICIVPDCPSEIHSDDIQLCWYHLPVIKYKCNIGKHHLFQGTTWHGVTYQEFLCECDCNQEAISTD